MTDEACWAKTVAAQTKESATRLQVESFFILFSLAVRLSVRTVSEGPRTLGNSDPFHVSRDGPHLSIIHRYEYCSAVTIAVCLLTAPLPWPPSVFSK